MCFNAKPTSTKPQLRRGTKLHLNSQIAICLLWIELANKQTQTTIKRVITASAMSTGVSWDKCTGRVTVSQKRPALCSGCTALALTSLDRADEGSLTHNPPRSASVHAHADNPLAFMGGDRISVGSARRQERRETHTHTHTLEPYIYTRFTAIVHHLLFAITAYFIFLLSLIYAFMTNKCIYAQLRCICLFIGFTVNSFSVSHALLAILRNCTLSLI